MWRGALLGVLAGIFAFASHCLAGVEKDAAIEAYTLAMEAYIRDAVTHGSVDEEFLCGYGIENRLKSIKPIAVAPFESQAGWHISELVCAGRPVDVTAGRNTRYLMNPVPVYGLSGFELEFQGRSPQKLNSIGIAFQSRSLERFLRRRDLPTVPMSSDLIGDGQIRQLRIGRELIQMAWKLRLADQALDQDNELFGRISSAERNSLSTLMDYLSGAPEPDEDAFISYKDQLFPGVFEILDHLGYAYFQGPAQLSLDRIARELFFSRNINRQGDVGREFMLSSDEDKIELITDMMRTSDVRRGLTLLAQKEERRGVDEQGMPTVYTVFDAAAGRDPIKGRIDYIPLNWGGVREAARPADESHSRLFVQKADAASAASSMMRSTAAEIRGIIHGGEQAKISGGGLETFGVDRDLASDVSPGDPLDILWADDLAVNRFSSNQSGLSSPEAQNTLTATIEVLQGVIDGLAGKPWAESARAELKAARDGLVAVKTLEQDLGTQVRLADAASQIEAVEQGLSVAQLSPADGAGILNEAVLGKLREARARLFDVRALLYDGHAELFRSQTKECSKTCHILVDRTPYEGEVVLAGFFVGRTGGKSARLKEFSIEPARIQGFDVFQVIFADKDGYENTSAYVQYAHVPTGSLAYGKSFKVTGVGPTTVTRSSMAGGLVYPIIQSFSLRHAPDTNEADAVADVVVQKLGFENTGSQTRAYVKAVGRDGADVSDKMAWSLGLVEVLGSTVTRPSSGQVPFQWPPAGDRSRSN